MRWKDLSALFQADKGCGTGKSTRVKGQVDIIHRQVGGLQTTNRVSMNVEEEKLHLFFTKSNWNLTVPSSNKPQ